MILWFRVPDREGPTAQEDKRTCHQSSGQKPAREAAPVGVVSHDQGSRGRGPSLPFPFPPACALQLRRCPAAGPAGLHRLPAWLQVPRGRREGQDSHSEEVWGCPEASTAVLGLHTGTGERRSLVETPCGSNTAPGGTGRRTASLEDYSGNPPFCFLEIVGYVFRRSCVIPEFSCITTKEFWGMLLRILHLCFLDVPFMLSWNSLDFCANCQEHICNFFF